jgi:hypothetical protein
MASPFSIFRKNQRLWMAGAVLIAILAFVVAPMLESFSGYGRNSRPGASAVAASWSGGSITQEQIESELSELAITNTFLRKLAVDVREKGGFPQVPEVSPDFTYVGIAQESRDPATIVQRKLFVEEAKRLGIYFDDQSVKTFLTRFVDGKLNGEQIQKSLREVSGGRMTLIDFYRVMKEELAKNAVLRLSNSTLRFEDRINSQGLPVAVITPPSKNWQYFQRFNRSVSIEAFPVFVNDFADSVTASPSDRELRALFDEGKSISRIETSIQTQPAFMIPSMSDFEFLSINVDQLIEEEKAKITEEALRAEYDRRVKENQFRIPDTTPLPETPATETPAADTQPAEPPQADVPGSEPPAGNLPPTLENPSQDPPPPTQSQFQPDGKPMPLRSSGAKLVRFQDPPPVTTEPVTTEPQATEPPATEPGATLTIEPPAEGTTTTASPEPANLPRMRIQTFEEVKDSIAREMAMGEAYKVLEQRATEIRDLMEIHSVNRRAYERAVQEKDKTATAPEPINLQQIADKYGFQYGRTGLVDARTVRTLPIGQSRVTRGIRMQPFEFFELIMIPPDPLESDRIGNLYVPLASSNLSSRFIFWKVDHKESSTPTFEAAKDEVKKLWTTQRATELAETKAREIASRVGTSSVAESLEDENQRALVVRPAPFTWFNAMFANFDIQLSNVEGLQAINNDFMEKVFSAQPGETIVVSDAAKEIFYVVKVGSFFPSDEDLLSRFASAPNTTGIRNVANLETRLAFPAWFSNLQKQLGLRQP